MEDYYQIAVGRDVGNELQFPNKCAYCLEPTRFPRYLVVKHKELKGYKLRVPYCETHSRIIRYMKAVHYGAFSFSLLIAAVIGRYLHNHQVFVFGAIGLNYIAAGFIFIAVWIVTFFTLHFIVLWRFAVKGTLDKDGAVHIVGVHPNGFVLLFYNKTFGIEFLQLNYSALLDKQK
jgi:hypothetical protein